MKYSTENRNRASCWRRGALAALSLGLTASLALAPSAALAAGNSDEGTTEKTATVSAGLGASAVNVAAASMASVPTGRAVAAAAAAGATFAEGAPAAAGATSKETAGAAVGVTSEGTTGATAGTTPEGAAGVTPEGSAGAVSGDAADTAAPSQADAEETYSVTFYHSEMVFYDDPAYVPEDDPRYEGFRLMQAVTVDGFKPGDVVRAWDYVGTAKGFTFFDGWPAEIVVSEDESKNAIQLNYFRDTSNCTVNHYVIYDGNAPLPMRAGGTPLPLESLDASSIEVAKIHEETLPAQLFGEQLTGEDYADVTKLTNPSNPDEQLGGMTLVGTYPSKMFVSTDADRNELNLFYAVAAENLPDDVPVDAEGPEAGGDNSGAGGGSNGGGSGSDAPGSDADNDAGNGEGGADSGDDNGAGNGGAAGGSDADQGQQGGGSDSADGADNASGSNAADATGSDADGADSSSLKGKALPTTGDDASGATALPLVMGCALGGALFAHRQRTKA